MRLLIPARKDTALYHPRDMAKDAFKFSDTTRHANELSDLKLQEVGIAAIVTHIHQSKAAYRPVLGIIINVDVYLIMRSYSIIKRIIESLKSVIS